MNICCYNLLLFFFVGFLRSTFSFQYITNEEFLEKRESLSGICVLIMHGFTASLDDALRNLQELSETTKELGFDFLALDCTVTDSDICLTQSKKSERLLLFKEGKLLGELALNEINTPKQARSCLLDILSHKVFHLISSKEDWRNLKRRCLKNLNIVFAYVNDTGENLHRFLALESIKFHGKIQFAYTTDHALTCSLFPEDDVDSHGTIWLSLCDDDVQNNDCITVRYSGVLSQSSLNVALMALTSPRTLKVDENVPESTISEFINSAAYDKMDIVMLIPSIQKFTKTLQLAHNACSRTVGQVRCLVVKADADIEGVSDFVLDNRIYLSLLSMEGEVNDLNVGHLFAETADEILYHWQRLVAIRTNGENSYPDLSENHDKYEPDEWKTVYEKQDDPIAHSIHSSKSFHDFYLYDYKTIPRLSDVDYENLIASPNFAVILFTLEFNAKSLAVLSIFAHIHREYQVLDQFSPLHRVECYDWPDICQKIGFTTFPQMVFYHTNGPRVAHEYNGMWTSAEMQKGIKLHSVAWPVVVHTKIDLLNLLEDKIDYMFGVFLTADAKKIFMKAALEWNHQYLFVVVQGNAAYYFEHLLDSPSLKENIIIGRSNRTFKTFIRFVSNNDIVNYLSNAFRDELFQELTVSNFAEIIGHMKKSLFIQYKNITAIENESANTLSKLLTDFASVYKDLANFVWVDISPGSPGEYIYLMHTEGNGDNIQVAFLNNQKNISLQSFNKILDPNIVGQWIERCLSGTAKVSFNMIGHSWEPHLPGHDYLQYMLNEGTLPIDENNAKYGEEDQEFKTFLGRSSFKTGKISRDVRQDLLERDYEYSPLSRDEL
ncbi:unnamed protein product [Clavelina lepadiformis]|uniref:Thioredoxin domain-containing protein n=1 Tax=Clavelina lepadiformis TaxID=159417 RepID=A0ABP0GEM7_CLALP